MIRLDNRPLFKFLDISGLPPAQIETTIREALAQVRRAKSPLPKPCGVTADCRMAGGCPSCFAEIIEQRKK
jgi:hypothetical protein